MHEKNGMENATPAIPLLSPLVAHNKNVIFVSLLAGKEAMLAGAANFNRLASTQYKFLDAADKEALRAQSSKIAADCVPMTAKEIKKNASKIFKKIRNQVRL